MALWREAVGAFYGLSEQSRHSTRAFRPVPTICLRLEGTRFPFTAFDTSIKTVLSELNACVYIHVLSNRMSPLGWIWI